MLFSRYAGVLMGWEGMGDGERGLSAAKCRGCALAFQGCAFHFCGCAFAFWMSAGSNNDCEGRREAYQASRIFFGVFYVLLGGSGGESRQKWSKLVFWGVGRSNV
jgi:hypothetical protein